MLPACAAGACCSVVAVRHHGSPDATDSRSRGDSMAKSRHAHPALDATGRPSHMRGARSRAFIWAAVGFVAGTLFWSITGLDPNPRVFARTFAPADTSSTRTDTTKPADRVPTSLSAAGNIRHDCATLVLDRALKQTRLHPCTTDDPPLRFATSAGRQDRLAVVE